jgi:TolB protein
MRILTLFIILFFQFQVSAIEITIEKKNKIYTVFSESKDVEFNTQLVRNLSHVSNVKVIDNRNADLFVSVFKKTKKMRGKGYLYIEHVSVNSLTTRVDTRSRKHAANVAANQITKMATGAYSFFENTLIYVSKAKEKYRLNIADFEGYDRKTLLISPEPILSPDISPDGKFVAYVSFETVRPSVYLQNVKTRTRTLIANFTGVNGYPKFSPDGQYLNLSLSKNGTADIYRYDIVKKQLRQITSDVGNEISPTVSKRGALLFASDKLGYPKVYQLDETGGSATSLFKTKNYTISPAINDDYAIATYLYKGFYGILAKNLSSKKEHSVVKDFYLESPDISSDGNLIVYSTKEGRRHILKFLNIHGDLLYTLKAKNTDLYEPSF